MGHVDLTNGIYTFLGIFNIYAEILDNTTFTIGLLTFSMWELIWSIFFLFMFVDFLWMILGNGTRIIDD